MRDGNRVFVSLLRSILRWCQSHRIGRALRAVGLLQLAQKTYESRVLANGVLAATLLEEKLRFVVSSRMEITRLDNYFEEEVGQRLIEAVQTGDVFYDIGANIGMMCLLVASNSCDVEIHAFEPEPRNAERLRENIALNNFPKIRVHEIALAADTGVGSLYVSGDVGVGTHTILPSKLQESVSIKMFSGADWVQLYGSPPKVLKIDVEGAEMDVLLGFEPVIKNQLIRDIIVEIHPAKLVERGFGENAVAEWLHARGYDTVWKSRKVKETHEHFRCSHSTVDS